MKKILLALLAVLLIGCMIACNTTTPPDDGTGTTPSGSESQSETEATPVLPDKKYDGYSFRIISGKGVIVEDQNGILVDEAIYRANKDVEAQFDIDFEVNIELDWMDGTSLENLILSGEDNHDLSTMQDCTIAGMALKGYFLNINDLPYVNTAAKWWPQHIVESFTLNNKMYFYTNYSSYNSLAGMEVCFFNGDLCEDFEIDKPYDLVRSGDWTLAKLTEMVRNVYSDENGDTLQDDGDIYGLYVGPTTYRWLESFGVEVYQKTNAYESPEITLSANTDRVVGVVDALHNLFFGGHQGVFRHATAATAGWSMFAAGKSVFTFGPVGQIAPQVADSSIEYGVLPMPKADETQKSYYCGINTGLFAVPVNAKDPERTGVIIEAMAYEGYEHVMPAYATTTLKIRYTTDEDSKEMLDIAFANQVVSFAYLHTNVGNGGIQYSLLSTMKNNDVASYLASRVEAEQDVIDTITEFYGK